MANVSMDIVEVYIKNVQLIYANFNEYQKTYLKLILVTSDGGSLFLPKVIGLYDGHTVYLIAKVFLEYLQDGLNACHIVAVATHINQHRKPQRF